MSNDRIKAFIYLGAAAGIIGYTARDAVRIHREERLKRIEIEKNWHLDLIAIQQASRVMNLRIERGEIRSAQQLIDTMRTEIEFAKIAIRED